jgi:hypothetical protein
MRLSVIMMQNNSICQDSFAFTANSGFRIFFKYSTVPCTVDHLSTILVVLEDGPITVSKQRQHCFVSRRHIFEFLGPGRWRVFPLLALKFACRFIVVHPCLIACDKWLHKTSPSSWYRYKIECMFPRVSICAYLQAALVPTLYKFFDIRRPRGWWKMQIHSWCPTCYLYHWQ